MTKYADEAGDHDKPRRKLSLFRRCTRFLRPLRFPSSKGRSSIVMSTIGGFAFYLFTLVFPSLNPFVYVNSGFALSGESVSAASSENPIFSADDVNRKIIEIQEKMDEEGSNVKHPLDGIKAFSSYSDDQPSADSLNEPAKLIPDPQNIPSSAIQPMAVVAESASDEPENNEGRKPDPHKIPSSAITPMALDVDKRDEDEEQPEEGDEKHEENGNRDPPANINLEDLKKEEEDAMAELAEKEAYAKKQSKTGIKSKIYSKKKEYFDD